MNKHIVLVLGFFATLATLVGCSGNTSADSGIDSSAPVGIIAGVEADADSLVAKSTTLLISPLGVCTGALLNDHIVLTAAHCVGTSGSPRGITVGIQEGNKCGTVEVSKVSYPPNAVINSYGVYQPDLALLKLEKAACPPALMQLDPAPVAKDILKAAGFGTGLVGMRPNTMELKVVNSDTASVKALYFEAPGMNNSVYETWWKESAPVIEDAAKTYTFARPVRADQTLCSMDSGSPVYREKDGVLHIIGIFAVVFPHPLVGNKNCQSAYLNLFTPVAAYKAWINEKLKSW